MLDVRKKLIINSIEYDGYKILSMNIDFFTDMITIKVEYYNKTTKTTRDHKVEVGEEINLMDAIEQIHQIHNNITV
jgi:hypothetical protein